MPSWATWDGRGGHARGHPPPAALSCPLKSQRNGYWQQCRGRGRPPAAWGAPSIPTRAPAERSGPNAPQRGGRGPFARPTLPAPEATCSRRRGTWPSHPSAPGASARPRQPARSLPLRPGRPRPCPPQPGERRPAARSSPPSRSHQPSESSRRPSSPETRAGERRSCWRLGRGEPTEAEQPLGPTRAPRPAPLRPAPPARPPLQPPPPTTPGPGPEARRPGGGRQGPAQRPAPAPDWRVEPAPGARGGGALQTDPQPARLCSPSLRDLILASSCLSRRAVGVQGRAGVPAAAASPGWPPGPASGAVGPNATN